MTRTHHHGKYLIYGERRKKPDNRRLTRVLKEWADAKLEAEAEADAKKHLRRSVRKQSERKKDAS